MQGRDGEPVTASVEGWIDSVKRLGALINEANGHLYRMVGATNSKESLYDEPEAVADVLSQELLHALDAVGILGRQIDCLRQKF